MKRLLWLGLCMLPLWTVLAQEASLEAEHPDPDATVLDEIRFTPGEFAVDKGTGTASVTVTLTSLKAKPRELKINVYGIQVVDNERKPYYFSSLMMGRVVMRFDDKQNYLHYLLQPEVPVKLTITAEGIADTAQAIRLVKIVFEDSAEEGRFLEAYVTGSESAGGPSSPSDPSSF